MQIKNELLEFNKPSELTQVIFFENFKKQIIAKMSTTHLDLINTIMYLIKRKIIQDKIDLNKFDETILIDIDMKDLTNVLGKYKNSEYEFILEKLYELKKIDVLINSLGKVKDLVKFKLTSFIHTISWSKHKNIIHKHITIGVDREIIESLINRKKYFAKLFFKIQFSMKSKYSKLLYEVLKDYQGISSIIIDMDDLLLLLNLNLENKNIYKWSVFRPSILEKAIKEINEKSDIKVQYEAIKERTEDNPRLHVTKIKFTMEKQSEDKLKELGLLNQEPELSIEEEIYLNKIRLKSRSKLENLLQTGYEVKDKDSWVKADIKKNEKQYAAELDIDEYLNDLSDDNKRELYLKLAKYIKSNEPFVYIENYIIKDISNQVYTTNAMETLETLINFEESTNE